jgi:hypothetical protein
VHSVDCRGISPDCRRPELLDNELRRPAGVRPRPLLACVTQSCFQALLELFPVFLLAPRQHDAAQPQAPCLWRPPRCHACASLVRASLWLSPSQPCGARIPLPQRLLPSDADFRGAAAPFRTRQRRGALPCHRLSAACQVRLCPASLFGTPGERIAMQHSADGHARERRHQIPPAVAGQCQVSPSLPQWLCCPSLLWQNPDEKD